MEKAKIEKGKPIVKATGKVIGFANSIITIPSFKKDYDHLKKLILISTK